MNAKILPFRRRRPADSEPLLPPEMAAVPVPYTPPVFDDHTRVLPAGRHDGHISQTGTWRIDFGSRFALINGVLIEPYSVRAIDGGRELVLNVHTLHETYRITIALAHGDRRIDLSRWGFMADVIAVAYSPNGIPMSLTLHIDRLPPRLPA